MLELEISKSFDIALLTNQDCIRVGNILCQCLEQPGLSKESKSKLEKCEVRKANEYINMLAEHVCDNSQNKDYDKNKIEKKQDRNHSIIMLKKNAPYLVEPYSKLIYLWLYSANDKLFYEIYNHLMNQSEFKKFLKMKPHELAKEIPSRKLMISCLLGLNLTENNIRNFNDRDLKNYEYLKKLDKEVLHDFYLSNLNSQKKYLNK